MGIGIGNWDSGFGLGIGCDSWLGLGIEIWDLIGNWDWGLGFWIEIGNQDWGLRIGKWELGFGIWD